MASDELFPAKAVLKCPVCMGSMTSEMPLNRTGKTYYYYRCAGSQHVRFPKKKIDDLLEKVLQEISISPAAAKYAQKRIKERAREASQAITNRITVLRQKHEQAAARVKKARGLVVDGVLSAEDLAEIKAEFTEIGGQIAEQEFFKANQGRIAKIALSMLGNLSVIKEKATPEEFAYFLRVLFPEGFTVEPHDLGHCRTTRINSIFSITALGTAVYSSIKIENVRSGADIPGMGPFRDGNRTALGTYRADLQAAENFYFEVFVKIAA